MLRSLKYSWIYLLLVGLLSVNSFAYDNVQKLAINLRLSPQFVEKLAHDEVEFIEVTALATIGCSRKGTSGFCKGSDDQGKHTSKVTYPLNSRLGSIELSLSDFFKDGRDPENYEFRRLVTNLEGIKKGGSKINLDQYAYEKMVDSEKGNRTYGTVLDLSDLPGTTRGNSSLKLSLGLEVSVQAINYGVMLRKYSVEGTESAASVESNQIELIKRLGKMLDDFSRLPGVQPKDWEALTSQIEYLVKERSVQFSNPVSK
jgi:hypothetical protein